MGIRILTNVQSLAAQRHLNVNSASQRTTLEHLSSGSRINRAADDAAGLGISEKMKGQIRSLTQASRNANDGISLVQTAEGSMNEISNILVRFRELAIQSASDTLGDDERKYTDKEVQQLKQEITRISNSTEFNGKKVLNGVGSALSIQVGANNKANEDRIDFDPQKMNATTDALGIDSLSVSSKESAQDGLSMIDNAQKHLMVNRSDLGAFQNRLQSIVNNLEIYTENLSGANSRIRDADIAQESADMMRSNILTQTGVAVLSQANSNSAVALKLIG